MANRTVNQLPGTLDHTTIAGADKLLVDDVSDAETKSIIVDEAALAFAPKSKLDATAAPDDAVDNEAAGYRTGSLWLWAAQSRIWVYLVVTPGTSAGWLELKEGSQSAAEELTDAVGSSPVVGDLVRVATGVYGVRQTNLGTTTDPTVDDDENAEYSGGSVWINKANGSVWICVDPTLGAAVWRRIDVTDAWTDIVISPAAVTTPDENGRSIQIIGGTAGPADSGAPYGGALELDAGGPNGPGTTGGNVKIGRGNADEITSGVEGTGSPWTHEGDFTVVAPGGLTNRMQVQAGGVTVAGTLKRKSAVRTVTTSTVLTADDQVVIVDASAGAITLTAPDPADLYEPILILKKSTGANAISIATPSGQINGAASPQALPDSTSTLRPSWTLLTDGTDTWSA